MKDLQKKLKSKISEFNTIQKINKHLVQLDQRIAKEQAQLDKTLKRIEKENEDAEKLEKMSIKSIFHKILGDKEKQLEKERQEYLQAALKYDEHRKTLELLEYEREVLEKKLAKAGSLEKEINQLIEQRKKELLQVNPTVGKQLVQITFNIEHHQKMMTEMKEAIQVGTHASQILNQMIGLLRQAKNWGNWDMIDGKRMSSYLKHSRLDSARQLSYKAKQVLMQYEDELNDVYQIERQQFDFSLNFNSFSNFTDIFLDNLISDWIVQQKISNALATVRATHDKVIRSISYLKADLPKQEEEIQRLEQLKTDLIVNT